MVMIVVMIVVTVTPNECNESNEFATNAQRILPKIELSELPSLIPTRLTFLTPLDSARLVGVVYAW